MFFLTTWLLFGHQFGHFSEKAGSKVLSVAPWVIFFWFVNYTIFNRSMELFLAQYEIKQQKEYMKLILD